MTKRGEAVLIIRARLVLKSFDRYFKCGGKNYL